MPAAFSKRFSWSCALASAALSSAPAHASAEYSIVASAPEGFSELQGPRDVVVDVFFGGRRLGDARANVQSGTIRFKDPQAVAGMLADYADPGRLSAFLAKDMQANSDRACSLMNSRDCGLLHPQDVGVIFSEDQFRADIFVNPELLLEAGSSSTAYLEPTSAGLGIVNSFGAAISGSFGSEPIYNLQSRTVVGLGSSRFKTNNSYSSDFGLVVDDMVLETDRPDRRYSAGLFWAPGTGLTGRTRILGVGAATQFDTRVERDQLIGTPIAVFLQQSSQVDILIDGRLIGSQVLDAGNQLLDTSMLPEGSYPIVLKIREPGRAVREEQRFFIKDSRIAPVGQTVFQAFAGMLAPTRRDKPIYVSDSFYYQAGLAKRLSKSFGVDATVLGTEEKALAEAGLYYLTRIARVRFGGLISTSGDVGALAQVSTTGSGPAHLSFDLRRVWSASISPLIPGSYDGKGFDAGGSGGAVRPSRDYLQMNAAAGLRFGSANFRIFASYFDTENSKSEFSIGPSFDWLFFQRQQFQLRLEGDAQKTRRSSSAYLGVRFLVAAKKLAVSGSAGHRWQDTYHPRSRAVGSIEAELSDEAGALGRYVVGAGIDRTIETTIARSSGTLYTQHGVARGDLLHDFSGRTQYGLSVTTGAIVGGKDIQLGGRNINESAVLIGVNSKDSDATFDVLVNDATVAKVAAGEKAALFLTPYRRYDVRIRQAGSAMVTYDASSRRVTLFPGTVAKLDWDAVKVRTTYGRLIGSDGTPIRNALLQGKYGVGQSNEDGYFQIDTGSGDDIRLQSEELPECRVSMPEVAAADYQAVGDVQCR